MALSQRQRKAFRSGVTELFVKVCALLGLGIGLLYELDRPAPAPPAACRRSGADQISGCFSEGLLATVWPYAVAMGLGVGLGAVIGLLISRLMLGGNHVPRGRRTATTTMSPPADSGDGRWITARYDGACHNCGSPISAGERILHRPKRSLCGSCA